MNGEKTLGDYIKNLEEAEHRCQYCQSRCCNCNGECEADKDDEFIGCPCVVVGKEENK